MKYSKISSEEPKIKGDAKLPAILLLPTFVVLNKSEERRYLERSGLPVPILRGTIARHSTAEVSTAYNGVDVKPPNLVPLISRHFQG